MSAEERLMPVRPDLDTLERLLAEYEDAGHTIEDAGGIDALADMIYSRVALEDAAIAALPFLLAEARKVETLTTEVAKLRADLRYLAEWDETKAAVLGSPDFRLIARAALEGASDEPRIDTCVECAAQVAALRGALRMAHLWLDLAAPDNVVLEVIAALEGEPAPPPPNRAPPLGPPRRKGSDEHS